VQFVPRIAPEAAALHLFQRTPPWVMPKPDREMPQWAKAAFRHVPGAQRAYRNLIYWLLESRAIGFNGHPNLLELAEKLARKNIAAGIADPELRAKVTPDYRMGCKRVLIANDYYPALARDNVDVVTSGVAEVREHSIVATDGTEYEADAIIYGTGFHVTDAFDNLELIGQHGANLAERWSAQGMQTHLGITVADFPNLFFLLGPNTGLGHNSVVFMIEQQIRYVAEAIELTERHGADALTVRRRVQERFNQRIQAKLVKGVWTQGGCTSWYLDSRGVNRTVWPGFTWRYWMATRRLEPADFELIGRGHAESRAVSRAPVAAAAACGPLTSRERPVRRSSPRMRR
jgi:cation diffusion facilitator CzcD-associated flavoprotein CzcO